MSKLYLSIVLNRVNVLGYIPPLAYTYERKTSRKLIEQWNHGMHPRSEQGGVQLKG